MHFFVATTPLLLHVKQDTVVPVLMHRDMKTCRPASHGREKEGTAFSDSQVLLQVVNVEKIYKYDVSKRTFYLG
jgi:hypothetical protein